MLNKENDGPQKKNIQGRQLFRHQFNHGALFSISYRRLILEALF